MKQVFYHYTKWEDFQNGMYDEEKEGRQDRVQMAVAILSNTKLLYECMKRVTVEWKFATEQNLTNPIINHQAFLGQAACNIHAGIKEDETREAWGYLTELERKKANMVADIVDAEWKRKYMKGKEGYQYSIFDEVET